MRKVQLCLSICFVLFIVSGCIPFTPYTSVSFTGEYTSFKEMASLYSPYDDSFSADYYHAPESYRAYRPDQPQFTIKLNPLEIDATKNDINVIKDDHVYVTIKKPLEFSELYEASISPSGEYLLFSVTQQIGSKVYVVHLESGEYHYISDQEIVKHPRWSPDGKLIALAVGSMDNEKLGFYSIEQKKLITIGKEALINIVGINWGHDGSFLDFIVEKHDSKTLPFMLVRYHFRENRFEKLYDLSREELIELPGY